MSVSTRRERQLKRERRERRRHRNSVLATLCFLTALAFLLSGGAVTLAKYVMEHRSVGTAVAAPFYFTSDTLGEGEPYCPVQEPEGDVVTLTFTLSNYIDSLRYSPEKISYTCTASAADGTAISLEKEGATPTGELSGKNAEKTVTLILSKSDFTGGPVTVTAQAAPYGKTLSARFGFSDHPDGLQWAVTEENGALVLEISGGDGSAVTVAWPDTVTPDPSSDLLTVSGTSGTFTAASGVRYALVFLKTDPGAGTEGFTVTQGAA